MSKPRRLHEIRAKASAERERIKSNAEALENFTLPRPKSWRAKILILIAEGMTLQESARSAGISRSGLRHARQIDPAFATAFEAAHRKGLGARHKPDFPLKGRKQFNDNLQQLNDEKTSRERIHCQLGAEKLTRRKRHLMLGIAPVAIALPWQKSLISPPSGRMARAL